MKDKDDNILIEGFYDDVRGPTPAERKVLEECGFDTEKQYQVLGVKRFIGGVTGIDALQRSLYMPTCNIAGIQSGYTGPGKQTVLPSKAFAKMDFRLVPEQKPDDILEKIKRHMEKLGIEGIEVVPLGGSIPPSYAPLESDIAQTVINAARTIYPRARCHA